MDERNETRNRGDGADARIAQLYADIEAYRQAVEDASDALEAAERELAEELSLRAEKGSGG